MSDQRCDWISDRLREVQGNDVAQARRLLVEGDARDRVVAAWVVGLDGSPASLEALRRRLYDDEDAGVRRHVATILTGAGFSEDLVWLSRQDPSAYVRATAVRLFARLRDEPRTEAVLAEALDDEASPVRLEAVRALRDHPGLDRTGVRDRLDDDDPRVRLEAARVVLDAELSEADRRRLVARAIAEPHPTTRRCLVGELADAGLLEALVVAATERGDLASLLVALGQADRRLSWALVQRGDIADRAYRQAVVGVLPRAPADALARLWLLRLVLAARYSDAGERDVIDAASRRLVASYRDLDPGALDEEERLLLSSLAAVTGRGAGDGAADALAPAAEGAPPSETAGPADALHAFAARIERH